MSTSKWVTDPALWKRWRPYQKDCFAAVSEYYLAERGKGMVSAMVVQATGLGKRSQSVFLACKMSNCLFLADSEELIEQAYNDFVEVWGIMNVGIVKGDRFEIDRRIVISSPQTMHRRLSRIPPDLFDMVQIDEAHKYMAKTYVSVVEYFKCKLRIGWTATPYRLDGLSLGNLFDSIVYSYDILNGINAGYLAELKGIRVKTNIDLKSVGKSMGDFKTSELTAIVDTRARNCLIADSYIQYANERQGICFACDITHAKNLKEVFDEKGITSEILVSDEEVTADRKGVVNAFKSRQFMILINVNMATTGFDYNNVGVILWARPTMSLTLYVQGCGRGTRLKDEEYTSKFGQQCLVLDFVDNTTKHQLVNAYSIDYGKNTEDRIFTSREDKDRIAEAKAKRERVFTPVTDVDQEVSLMILPTVEYDINRKWMHDAPSESQIEFAKRIGVYADDVTYTKGMLSEAIANSPALPSQFKMAREWGYDLSGGLTRGQFELIRKKHDDRPARMDKSTDN